MSETNTWVENLCEWADTYNIPHDILPREKNALVSLSELDLSDPDLYAKVDDMQEHFGEVAHKLGTSKPKAFTLPEEIGCLQNLQSLDVCFRELTYIPRSIGKLSNLKALNLAYNELRGLPMEIENLSHLKYLNLTGNTLIVSRSQAAWIDDTLQPSGCEIHHDAFRITSPENDSDEMDHWGIKNEYVRKPKKCPACKQEHVAPILYGYPTYEDSVSGKYFIGGCTIERGRQYHWGCLDCEFKLYKKPPKGMIAVY